MRNLKTPGDIETQSNDSLPPDVAEIVRREVERALASKSPQRVEVELPDQSMIDPQKITSMTLTAQGWVMPSGYAAQPDNKRGM